MNYAASPTMARFHSARSFGRWVVGPVGSGKTTGSIMDLFITASIQAPASDGLRHSRMALIRNTMQQLKTTVLSDVLQLLRGAATFHVTTSTIQIRANDIHSDWILFPLDTEEDQKRLLSTQLTAAYLNEFREIPQKLVASISGRVGRYPNKTMGVDPRRFGVIGDSNPFADGSEWTQFLEGSDNPDHQLFRQPSGTSPQAENRENLVPGYYERLIASFSEEWVNVHVHGLNGEDLAGSSVFKTSYSPRFHNAPTGLEVNRMRPLVIGLDLGRTPTAIITQIDPMGRMLIQAEVTSDDMGLRQFLREKLRPMLASDLFYGMRAIVIADPAGRIRSQYGEETAFDVLKAEGLFALPASTNDIEPRLRAVEKPLLERRGEGAALLIDPNRCPLLIQALSGKYRYKRRSNGAVDETPEKSHPWSDLADALQYACLGHAMDAPSLAQRYEARRSMAPARPVPVGGWT